MGNPEPYQKHNIIRRKTLSVMKKNERSQFIMARDMTCICKWTVTSRRYNGQKFQDIGEIW